VASNLFGHHFCVTSFGESHGSALGAVIDGCPANVPFDEELLLRQIRRRRPGQSDVVSGRNEADQPEVLSGVFQGKTLGTPIAMIVRNHDQRSEDYAKMADRAGHADDLLREKYVHVDPRGGGRSSGRETVARVMAGAVAEMVIRTLVPSLEVVAFASQIGPMAIGPQDVNELRETITRSMVDQNSVRLPHPTLGPEAEAFLREAKLEGHSYGGVAEVVVRSLPRALGQPVFHKLKSDLAAAVMSIGATCGVEFGSGFSSTEREGSVFHASNPQNYGGIRGGISTGDTLSLRVAFKPTSSVLDLAKKGRHDPCIVPRAVPVLEAMVALVLADHLLWRRLDQIEV
jgi:chorismate synthase